MNPFVADPEWGWWIIFYFFLGGIAAGAHFLATLIELFGQEEDRPLARLGYRVAFPLIGVCGILLIVDLDRPERFWHMMFQSERVHEALDAGWPRGGWGTMVQAPILKWWSPISIGAWALAAFGAWSLVSFVTTFWNPRGPALLGHIFRLVGSLLGFFVASYTGVLLNATNQPLWSESVWIAPLFLTSAASTAIAVLLLLGRRISTATRERLEKADLCALGLELFLFLLFLASLGRLLPNVLQIWQGQALVCGTLVAGLFVPLLLHLGFGQPGAVRVTAAAASTLAGGFILRFGIVSIAPALLHAAQRGELVVSEAALWRSWEGIALIALTLTLAVSMPLFLCRKWSLTWERTGMVSVVSLLASCGVLFYALEIGGFRLSPEDDRERGGGFGASFFNRPADIQVRSKIIKTEQ